jgi:hypothetical protein
MGLVDRVKNILVTPKTEWDVIAAETTPPKDLIIRYVLPLAGAAAVATFIKESLIGTTVPFLGTVRVSIEWGLVDAITHLIMGVVGIFLLGFIIDALAPKFGAQKNMQQATKVAIYACTAAWVGTVLRIVPWIGGIFVVIGAIYALYLLYLGLPRLMKSPDEKSLAYTGTVIGCIILIGIAVGIISWMVGGTRAGMGYGARTAPPIVYEKDSKMAKLDEFARKMEEAGKKMEAAQKSGDPKKQMEASMAALGTAMSGGKGVEPVQIDQLKPFLPATFAGMPQTSAQAERSGVTGLMVAKAKARYGDASGKNAGLEVTDTGGAAGLMGLASWMGVQTEREDDNRSERTRREGNRMIHEEVDKRGGRNKYSVVLADRYVVAAEANGVDIGALKSAVNSLDLAKLESLK